MGRLSNGPRRLTPAPLWTVFSDGVPGSTAWRKSREKENLQSACHCLGGGTRQGLAVENGGWTSNEDDTGTWMTKLDSSAESVGELWLRETTKCLIRGEFQEVMAPQFIRSFRVLHTFAILRISVTPSTDPGHGRIWDKTLFFWGLILGKFVLCVNK